MSIKTISISGILSLILLASSVFAQEQTATGVTVSSSTAVTASVTEPNAIRLSSPGGIFNIRLEVYTANGDLAFDSGLRQGNVVDAGQATLKTQRGNAINEPKKQALNTRLQSQKIALADSVDAVTVLRPGKERSVVVTAHDGTDGQVTSTSGALTFRTGDALTGNEQERVRITPEGNIGIGTDKPEATLHVAGEIRARGSDSKMVPF